MFILHTEKQCLNFRISALWTICFPRNYFLPERETCPFAGAGGLPPDWPGEAGYSSLLPLGTLLRPSLEPSGGIQDLPSPGALPYPAKKPGADNRSGLSGDPLEARTPDPLIKSQMLCQLS